MGVGKPVKMGVGKPVKSLKPQLSEVEGSTNGGSGIVANKGNRVRGSL